MSKRIHSTFCLLILLVAKLSAQEGLRPMHGNAHLLYQEAKADFKKSERAVRTTTGSLSLPFFDDFYYATRSAYPSNAFWTDSSVYVNTGMARTPLSIGVATFDGLNKNGYPHFPSKTYTASDADSADVLTSQPINLLTVGSQTLQPSDSIALIFYYQQTGNGDSPEAQDSLVVDLFKPSQNIWSYKVWALKGNANPNGADTIFKRVFIWIKDTAYLHDGFKFRFRNKASGNGNYDNWHIDYVYLDKGRSMKGDTAWNDLTIGYVPSPFLKNYSAMPWHQYNANPNAEMGIKFSNFIRYNGTSTINTTYEYRVFDAANTQLNFISYGAANLAPFKPGGWQSYTVHSTPSTSYTFPTMTDSTDLTIKHYMQAHGGDISVGNDTVLQKQLFRNYYAYDDGSCETGYYVNNFGAYIVQKYTFNVTDTLRALRILFDPVATVPQQVTNPFRIKVFGSNGSGPGSLLYSDSLMYPKYSTTGQNVFATYTLTTPMEVGPQTYYIGIQQKATGQYGWITIGFDKNYNSSSNLYYDSGNGWNQSSYYGSLMMRPVVGKKVDPPVGVEEYGSNQNSNIKVYPNPASNRIHVLSEAELQYSIYSMEGKLIASGNSSNISTQEFGNGIYLLQLSSQGKVQYRQKIIIQH